MVKKLFVLASVTGLTGMMTLTAGSGCSSTNSVTTADETGPTTQKEAGKPPADTGPPEDSAPGPTTCPTSDPITAADIEMQVKWQAPAAIQTKCTQQNIDDLKALFVKGGGKAKFADIKTSLGATCSPCVFSKSTDANWQVLVEEGMGTINNVVGSCLAQIEGAACGKAFFESDVCFQSVCPPECTDQNGCGTKAAKGACKSLVAAANAACPNLQTDIDRCGGILDGIAVSCAGGTDAGIDASSM